ncbi:hypothetical protein [Paractinoplanes abujensis]|uniref:Uncharacterized protein n=1 Tax=Paractinoplanes abujensis TaxID=882441 RepID=A0A7W7D058_9ACTN|nr:hypothetical protein [Actinoplanes abujensis]MBB4697579.1 hypothetical protein [Actinoplanes abujensis]
MDRAYDLSGGDQEAFGEPDDRYWPDETAWREGWVSFDDAEGRPLAGQERSTSHGSGHASMGPGEFLWSYDGILIGISFVAGAAASGVPGNAAYDGLKWLIRRVRSRARRRNEDFTVLVKDEAITLARVHLRAYCSYWNLPVDAELATVVVDDFPDDAGTWDIRFFQGRRQAGEGRYEFAVRIFPASSQESRAKVSAQVR